jgi:hypothetical protein
MIPENHFIIYMKTIPKKIAKIPEDTMIEKVALTSLTADYNPSMLAAAPNDKEAMFDAADMSIEQIFPNKGTVGYLIILVVVV